MSIVTVNGGISVISAFINGIGAAVSIDLPMRLMTTREAEDPDPVLHEMTEWYAKRFNFKIKPEINVHSRIPRGQGLKSSSALAIGVIELLCIENGSRLADEEKLAAAAQVSREMKLSATGAYDDLSAAYFGGLALADNKENRLLLRKEIPVMPILIAYDANQQRSSYALKDSFPEEAAAEIETLVERVKKGSFLPVAALNGQIISRKTGIRNDLIDLIKGFHPLSVSQSGKGPAIFAVFKNTIEMRECASTLSKQKNIMTILTRTSNDPIQGVE